MRALTVRPGTAGTLAVETRPDPEPGAAELLVDGLAIGVCGTDKEIVRGEYGWAPHDRDRLVLGHESLGRVVGAPDGSGFGAGDLVAGVVRRPDPSRAGRARTTSGTCAATAATPSAGSRSSTATAASGGRCRRSTPSGLPTTWDWPGC